MQIHQLKKRTLNKKKPAVGRGGRRGKTSGRGHKGQKARAGRKIRPEIRDMIKKIPKRRGYGKNRAKSVNASRIRPEVVNLALLESEFKNGEVVSVKTLLEKGLVKKQGGKNPQVKILGKGDLKKKLTIKNLLLSETAKEKIAKGGSKIEK
jgi:large subunit ribosomal protein L15